MILDSGVCSVYRVDGSVRGNDSPTSGTIRIYNNWYGILNHEVGKGSEAGDAVMRIRLHEADVRDYDIIYAMGRHWRVTRVYHGTDDDTGQPIADVTLEGGKRHFMIVRLIPRAVSVDALNTITGIPDVESARTIWASVGSVEMTEYYAAQAVGRTLSLRVEVYLTEYAGEAYVEVDGNGYEVTRVEYRGPIAHLICEAESAWPE